MIGAMRWPLLIVTLLGFACSRAERQEHHAPDQLRTVRYPATATLPALSLTAPWLLDENPVPESPGHLLIGGDLGKLGLIGGVTILPGPLRPPVCRGEEARSEGAERDT